MDADAKGTAEFCPLSKKWIPIIFRSNQKVFFVFIDWIFYFVAQIGIELFNFVPYLILLKQGMNHSNILLQNKDLSTVNSLLCQKKYPCCFSAMKIPKMSQRISVISFPLMLLEKQFYFNSLWCLLSKKLWCLITRGVFKLFKWFV